jgi:hypothetical protein
MAMHYTYVYTCTRSSLIWRAHVQDNAGVNTPLLTQAEREANDNYFYSLLFGKGRPFVTETRALIAARVSVAAGPAQWRRCAPAARGVCLCCARNGARARHARAVV